MPVQTRNVKNGSGEVQVPPPKLAPTPAQPAATAASAATSQAAQADPPPAPPKPTPAKPAAANAQAEKPAAGTQVAAVEPQEATPPVVAPSAKPAAPAPAAAAPAKPRGATNAPVNLLAAAPLRTPAAPARATTAVPPAPAAATAGGSGFVVQVSSQRSETDAQKSLANLQRQFGSVLGGLPTDIRQVDLGTKGVYYRVRVGSWPSRADAVSLCEKLRAAGGKCIVTQ